MTPSLYIPNQYNSYCTITIGGDVNHLSNQYNNFITLHISGPLDTFDIHI
jgi:hypothetical protein